MSVFHDHYEGVPEADRRADAGVALAGEFVMKGDLFVQETPGGLYAIFYDVDVVICIIPEMAACSFPVRLFVRKSQPLIPRFARGSSLSSEHCVTVHLATHGEILCPVDDQDHFAYPPPSLLIKGRIACMQVRSRDILTRHAPLRE